MDGLLQYARNGQRVPHDNPPLEYDDPQGWENPMSGVGVTGSQDRKKVNSFASMLSGTGGKNIFGQEVAPLTEEDLMMMVMGVTGVPMGGGKGLLKDLLKSGKNIIKGFPKARRVDPRFGRDVVTVEMTDKAGKIFKQPFYKSSGKSKGIGEASLRRGKWEPFVGRGKGGYKPHQYSKGWFTKADDYKFASEGDVLKNISKGMHKDKADLAARIGDWKSISDEISRLDKLGYYNKSLYHNIKGPEKLNKFLTEQGVKLPF